MTSDPFHPVQRPRRLRTSPGLRRLVSETRLHPADLILPVFVGEGLKDPRPIQSMPGVVQHCRSSLVDALQEAAALGVGGVMVFGIPLKKDAMGSGAVDPNGILSQAIRWSVEASRGLPIIADLCLDEYTDHGHCGVLDRAGRVDNDATLRQYAAMGNVLAEAGASVLGMSGMMDGQIAAVRSSLDAAGHYDTSLLAYAAKYASAFYGPFREAVQSSLVGDRLTYQQDPANAREAEREVALDVAEGADIVMVKPALSFLDVVARTKATTSVPVAAYVVSGEYSMVEAAAAAGVIDRQRAIEELLTSVSRAGADLIVTYWASQVAGWLHPCWRPEQFGGRFS
ncbi:MAG: porphobilinogen synthase [Propionibacteriaceae bacterium]|nr:porphobilinogen synthase [Micropruina sp.]